MQEPYVGRIEPGMDVCDIAGQKIGTIAHVHRHPVEPDTTTLETSSGAVATATRDEIFEVKTGPLGFGKHFYIPLSAIHDHTAACVFLNLPKEELEQQGWDRRPDS
jgi:hypothetical protein